MNISELSRYDFLKLARDGFLWLSAMLGLGGLLRFLGYDPTPVPPTEFDLGPASHYPIGSRNVVADGRYILIHDARGVRAISTTCTHLGCQVASAPDGFTCPCHGSRFTPDGEVRNGPAARALTELSVELADNGHFILYSL